MNIAIIPARGGSKRIPGKNIKPFVGKPIIAYSIEAALKSGVFDKVIVSTDSEEIGNVAKEFGAEVPFLRPEDISDDHTPTAPVISHAIDWVAAHGETPSYACCIYATAPFVQPDFIIQGLETMAEQHCSTCYSVTSFPFPIFRSVKVTDAGCLEMFWPEHEMTRSQDLEEAYHDAGQFYWVDCEKFLAEPRLYSQDSRPVFLPRHYVQDIDTPEDWIRAEYMFKALGLGGRR